MKIKFLYIVSILLLFPTLLFGNPEKECSELMASARKELIKENYIQSLELYSHAKVLAEENNLESLLMYIYRGIGLNYTYMSDYGSALSNFYEAYRMSLELDDKECSALVLNNISLLYAAEKKEEEAMEFMRRAYDIAVSDNDSRNIGRYAVNIASIANETGKLDIADEYIEIAAEHFKDLPGGLMYVNMTRIEIMISKGLYQQAVELSMEVMPEFTSSEDKRFIAHLNILLSQIYLLTNDYHKSIEYAENALDIGVALEKKVTLYEYMSKAYFSLKHYTEANNYKDSIVHALNLLHDLNTSTIFELNEIKLELLSNQRELDENKAKQKTERWIALLVGIMLIVLIWALYTSLRQYRQKTILAERNRKITELELLEQNSKKQILEQQYRERKALDKFEKEKLGNEIERKNRKLATSALLNSTRNNMMLEVIDNLLSDIDSAEKNGNVKIRLQDLKNQLSKNKEEDTFLKHFEEVNSHFIKSLKDKHPELSTNDVKFLSYIYMNLSTKEIANLFNIAVESCKRKKNRLRHKMNIPEDIGIYDYLMGLS